MAKTRLTQESYDKLIDVFAQELWFLRERWEGIKALRSYNKQSFPTWKIYHRFFNSVYRSFVYDFYTSVCRLVSDEAKEVESMIKLLKKSNTNKPEITDKKRSSQLADLEKNLTELLKKNPTLIKIKNQRDNFLAHRNSNLLFDEKAEEEFFNQNNPSPEEIEELLKTLEQVLTGMATRAKFYPLTDPDTSIKDQIKDIFSVLDKMNSSDT